jgi:hypothetical protein
MKTPWAIILCKFADDDSEPFPIQYYKDLFTKGDIGSNRNMVKFFNDCTHGNIDVSESQVLGWFKLSQSVADYNAPGAGEQPSSDGRTQRQKRPVTISRRSSVRLSVRISGAISASAASAWSLKARHRLRLG